MMQSPPPTPPPSCLFGGEPFSLSVPVEVAPNHWSSVRDVWPLGESEPDTGLAAAGNICLSQSCDG